VHAHMHVHDICAVLGASCSLQARLYWHGDWMVLPVARLLSTHLSLGCLRGVWVPSLLTLTHPPTLIS